MLRIGMIVRSSITLGGFRKAASTTERIYFHHGKAELLEEAAKLKIDVPAKATIADIEALITEAKPEKREKAEKEVVAERKADTAKAGKRSEKALEEAEVKAEKEARKAAGDTTPQGDVAANEKKGPAPKVRPLSERRGKNFRKVAEKSRQVKSIH